MLKGDLQQVLADGRLDLVLGLVGAGDTLGIFQDVPEGHDGGPTDSRSFDAQLDAPCPVVHYREPSTNPERPRRRDGCATAVRLLSLGPCPPAMLSRARWSLPSSPPLTTRRGMSRPW